MTAFPHTKNNCPKHLSLSFTCYAFPNPSISCFCQSKDLFSFPAPDLGLDLWIHRSCVSNCTFPPADTGQTTPKLAGTDHRWYGKSAGLPWRCSSWGSACRCRGHGFDPRSGKTPHAAGQRSPHVAATTDACTLGAHACTRGAPAMRSTGATAGEQPLLIRTRESPRQTTKIRHSQK